MLKILKSKPKATVKKAAVGHQDSLIAIAAYYIAEERGFQAGFELDDWLKAERKQASVGPSPV